MLEIEIKTIQDMTSSTGTLYTIYGKPGVGKTFLSGQFPKPLLYLSTNEFGIESLDKTNPHIYTTNIFQYNQFENFMNQFETIVNQYRIKTIVIDTIGGLQALYLKKITEGKEMPEVNDYGSWSIRLGAITTFLKNVVANNAIDIVIIAHERNLAPLLKEYGAERVGEDFAADLTPKASDILHSSSNIVIRLLIKEFDVLDAQNKNIIDHQGKIKKMVKRCGIIGNSPTSRTKVQTTNPDVISFTQEREMCDITYDKIQKLF